MSEKPTQEKVLLNLYAEFNRYATKGEYERCIKSINKILQIDNDDEVAFECKITTLIHLNKFEEVLQQLKRFPHLSSNLAFQHAYSLYRSNKSEESLAVIQAHPEDQRLNELKAQVLYRLDRFEESMELYNRTVRDCINEEYDEERQTNLAAVYSHIPNASPSFGSQLIEESYELCYNKALVNANLHNFVEAERLLKKAEKLLREVYEEDGSSEEEIEIEVANIRVLQAYCCQKQGRLKEAHQLYVNALKIKLEDGALIAVASNNVAAINKDQNVFDSKKKLKSATNETYLAKLPSQTRKTIALNNAIFNYYANQHEISEKLCAKIAKDWPELELHAQILKVLNARKLNPSLEPVDVLLKLKPKSKTDLLFLKLTCVHLLLSDGNKERACEILQDLGDYSYQPGIVGALITINNHLGRDNVALEVYEKTIEWHKRNEESAKDMASFFKQAAEFHMRNGRPEVAVKSLEQLLNLKQSDKKTVAQLIIAYSHFNEAKVAELQELLGSSNDLENDVDLDNLESTSWLTTKRATGSAKTEMSPGPVENVLKRRKTRKRRKLPKHYDASQTPDPERWLPKYERTGFRKKRDRRMKEIIKGSQGTTAGQSDQYDFSKVTEQEESPASVEPSPMQKSNQNNRQKKGNQKKKGNKRR